MSVNYEDLLQTLENEKMNEETTYTRGEAYQLAQKWRNEQYETILKEADQQMQKARDAYFQAIADYKATYKEVADKTRALTRAINGCFYNYDEFYGPVNVGVYPASSALMVVNNRQVHNYKLHLKGDDNE